MASASSGRPWRLYRCAATRSRSSAPPPSARILRTTRHGGCVSARRARSTCSEARSLLRRVDPSRAPRRHNRTRCAADCEESLPKQSRTHFRLGKAASLDMSALTHCPCMHWCSALTHGRGGSDHIAPLERRLGERLQVVQVRRPRVHDVQQHAVVDRRQQQRRQHLRQGIEVLA